MKCEGNVKVLKLGKRRQLFVDHYLIDRLEGARLCLHPPQPAETALTLEHPWEGEYCGYFTVIKDDKKYRMYYRGLPKHQHGPQIEVTCYAESMNGITWTKPNLGLFEVRGTFENNVILANSRACHNFAPFLDTKPGVHTSERFKALGGSGTPGLIAFVSADGIRWKQARDAPVLTKGAFDSQNVAFWTESEGCYVCYFRTGKQGVRWVSRATSQDFLNWSEPVEMSFGDVPPEHLYTNQTHPYFRAPHIYIAFPTRFMPSRRALTDDQMETILTPDVYKNDCTDVVFMSTRGGARYYRNFMEAYLRPGLDLRNWTSRANYAVQNIVPTGPTEMSLYVTQNLGYESNHVRRYTIRYDGFVSVKAPYAGGEMLTKPITFSGKELEINFATSAAGSVRLEITDEAGKPIEGYSLGDCPEIIGDQIERLVSWKGGSDVSKLAGKVIRLKFAMKDADLYSLRFRG